MRKQTDTLRTVVLKVSCVTVNSELKGTCILGINQSLKLTVCIPYTTLYGKLRIMQPLFSIDVQ